MAPAAAAALGATRRQRFVIRVRRVLEIDPRPAKRLHRRVDVVRRERDPPLRLLEREVVGPVDDEAVERDRGQLFDLQDHVARREAGLAGSQAGDPADAHALARLQAELLDGLAGHRDLGELAFQIKGKAGIVLANNEFDEWQRLFLFSRADTIYGGSNEIQRNIIAERVLGLPREVKG